MRAGRARAAAASSFLALFVCSFPAASARVAPGGGARALPGDDAQAESSPAPQARPPAGSEAQPDARRLESRWRDLMYRGMRAVEIGEYATGAQLLEGAVKMKPGSAEAHYQLARALLGLKRHRPAGEMFEQVLKIEPGHVGALMGLGAIGELTGDYASAEARYREAIKPGPNPKPRRALASLLGRTGRSAEAQEILDGLVAADPNDADSRFERGLAKALKGDCAAAVPDLEKVVKQQPDRVAALFHLGNCLNRVGRPEEAASVLERFRVTGEEQKRATEREKKVHFTLLEADELAAAGKVKEALAKADEAVRTDPDSAPAHAFRAGLFMDIGRNDLALPELKRTAELDPADAISRTEIGRLLGAAGKYDEAMVYLQAAVKVDPNLAAPHRFLAVLYEQMGRREEAEREKAIFQKLSGAP